ncbi:unnamed protein product [Pleuronectes platessa]|uniref:Protein kinase domain-containing protein n=1 Tax=Pleuronectes platessa TaxID=8262 RepID=A0A9N7YFM2_PLEPL|nr:unnamed protein product [Pleuronectes platessa]
MSDNRVLEFKMGDLIPSPTAQYRVQKHLGCGTQGIVVQCRNEDYCLVFEHLGIDLHKFMKNSPAQHLELKEIRPILQQLATSLEFLKRARIVHADLKPQNIVMVDHVRQPLKVKVIDFGLACDNPEEQIGHVLQSLWYRAPEILQKAPFNEAIDVWSLGCIAAELSMGRPLFPASDETNLMKQIEFTTGKQVKEGNLNLNWFWPKQWMETRFLTVPRLTWGDDYHAEICDLENFINLLTEMLMMNQFERITPQKILQHPFLTMSHFEGPLKNSFYVKLSKDLMNVCRDQTSDDLGRGDQINLRKSHNEASSSSALNLAEEGRPAGMGHEEHSILQTSTVSRVKKKKDKCKVWRQTRRLGSQYQKE